MIGPRKGTIEVTAFL